MKRLVLVCLTIILLSANTFANVEISSIWQSEVSVTKGSKIQKFEHIWKPELNMSLNDEMDLTIIARLRFDTQDNLRYDGDRLDTASAINGPLWEEKHFDMEVREWYLDTEAAGIFFRLGKQQVVWGQADGLKVLDVVNPQSYREFILQGFDDSRIPLWMVNAEIPIIDDDSLQLVWILDQTYHEFANTGSDYQMTSPLLVPQPVEGMEIDRFDIHKPNNVLQDSDLGLRYSKFIKGWDLTFNYLYHYIDTPIFFQQLIIGSGANTAIEIDAEYKRSHLIGFTSAKAFGNWALRTEFGYSSASYQLLDNTQPEFISNKGIGKSKDISSVIGIDWHGIENTMLSLQWFQSSLFDIESDLGSSLVRPKQNHIVSFMYQQSFSNETWQLEALVLYGVEQHDSSIQLKLSHMLEDNIKLWVTADTFKGDATSLFGQFDQTDRLSLGFEWGF